jgi:hypothetical protein
MAIPRKPARRATGASAKKAPAKSAAKSAAKRTAGAARTPKRSKPSPHPAARGNGAAAPAAAVERRMDSKPPKLKLVRDSFTIPRDEYGAIDGLKLRAAKLGRITKKSELLRAGLKLLAACTDAGLLGALDAVPRVKTGRPKGKRHTKDGAADIGAATRDA